MRKPLSSSERKGVLAVAGIALLITASGLIVSWCSKPESRLEPADVQVITAGDSVSPGSSRRSREHGDSAKVRKKKPAKQKVKKVYRKRSPLDEKVS